MKPEEQLHYSIRYQRVRPLVEQEQDPDNPVLTFGGNDV